MFVCLFVLMVLADRAQGHAVLPAFVLGLVMSRHYRHHEKEQERLRVVAFAFLTPFFFLRGGMNVSLGAVFGSLGALGLLVAAKMVPKITLVLPLARRAVPGHATFTTLLMSTGLTFGTISSLYGLNPRIIDRTQFSLPVCRRLRAAEERYWEGLLYEDFQDGGVLADFANAIGVCPRHPGPARRTRRCIRRRPARAREPSRRAAGAGGAGCHMAPTPNASRARAWSHMPRLPRTLDVRAPCPGHARGVARDRAGHGAALSTLRGGCFDHLRRAGEAAVPAVELLRRRCREILAGHHEALERLIAAHDYRADGSAADPESWKRAFVALRGLPRSTRRDGRPMTTTTGERSVR